MRFVVLTILLLNWPCSWSEQGGQEIQKSSTVSVPTYFRDEILKDGAERQARNSIEFLAQVREGRLHAKYLADFHEENELATLLEIEKWLQNSVKQTRFDDVEETRRMKAIDYLGEKLRHRIPSDHLERVASILQTHLKQDLHAVSYEKRQRQSLLGDQIEIIRYIALADPKRAQDILQEYEGKPIYAQLLSGVQNALWLRGDCVDCARPL